MNEFRKYWWVARTSFRSSIAYLGDTAGRVIFFVVILYIFLQLWSTTFRETGSTQLAGLTLTQMLWYLTITEAIMLSGPRMSFAIDEDVRTGALAGQLIRPMSYALYRLASNVGERFARFVINLIVGSLTALALVGPLNLAHLGLVTLALSLPLAFVLDFLGNFLVGLGAFWLEDTSGLLLIYSRGVLLAGGVLIPIQLYPPEAQTILSWLPFANIAAGPARLFVQPDVQALLLLLGRQTIVAIGFGLIVFTVYRTALKRVFVGGG
jgi:ABC-2 type transport system permease protein